MPKFRIKKANLQLLCSEYVVGNAIQILALGLKISHFTAKSREGQLMLPTTNKKRFVAFVIQVSVNYLQGDKAIIGTL